MASWMPSVDHVPTAAYGYPELPRGSLRARGVMSHIMQGYQSTMIEWGGGRRFSRLSMSADLRTTLHIK